MEVNRGGHYGFKSFFVHLHSREVSTEEKYIMYCILFLWRNRKNLSEAVKAMQCFPQLTLRNLQFKH